MSNQGDEDTDFISSLAMEVKKNYYTDYFVPGFSTKKVDKVHHKIKTIPQTQKKTPDYRQNITEEIDNKSKQKTESSEQIPDEFMEETVFPQKVAERIADTLGKANNEMEIDNNLRFDTMDFAGQPVYSATHPVFLPPRAVYLLTYNLQHALHNQSISIVKSGEAERKLDEHNPLTNLDHLKFWLSLVAANSTQEGSSPVFLVFTHADKLSETDAIQKSKDILAALKERDFLPGQKLERGIYIVDNTVSGKAGPQDPSILKLKADLREKVKHLPQCKEDIPYRWFLFEEELDLLRKEGKKEISQEDVNSIAKQCGVDTSTDELETLLNYLHDLKVIIHFPEITNIIINTKWLLEVFAAVITVQPPQCYKGFEDEWRRLEHEGVLDVHFLQYLWKDLLNDDTSVESLIAIMERFALVCKQQDGSFLVPAMLLNSSITEPWTDIMKDSLPSPLVIRFVGSHLPFGLFPRLVVAVDKVCQTEWQSSRNPHLSANFAR